jgi:hypothetical protein
VIDISLVLLRSQCRKQDVRLIQRFEGLAITFLCAQDEGQFAFRFRLGKQIPLLRRNRKSLTNMDFSEMWLSSLAVDNAVKLQGVSFDAVVGKLASDLKGVIATNPCPIQLALGNQKFSTIRMNNSLGYNVAN